MLLQRGAEVAPFDDRSGLERIADAVGESTSGEIFENSPIVVQLDKLERSFVSERVIHYFAYDQAQALLSYANDYQRGHRQQAVPAPLRVIHKCWALSQVAASQIRLAPS